MAQFTNQATLTYSGGTVLSNTVTGELLDVLVLSAAALPASYDGAGDVVTFTVSIKNSSSSDIAGLTLLDDLGAYLFGAQTLYPLTYVPDSLLFFSNGEEQTPPPAAAGSTVTFGPFSIGANGDAMLIYQARVNEYAPLSAGGEVTSEFTLTGGSSDPVKAAETISFESLPILGISKSLSPASVSENGTLTYTFIIQNSGGAPADADDNAVISDTFSPVLSALEVSFNGSAWTAPGNYSYDAAGGVFTTAAGQITVPAAVGSQDPVTGAWSVEPSQSVLTVTGTV